MKHNQVRQVVFPIITAMIWGSSFVAQSTSTEHIGAFTFNAARSFVGFLALLVVVQIFRMVRKEPEIQQTPEEKKAGWKGLVLGGICCGIALALACNLQQLGMVAGASAGKTSFITTLYVVLVPICGLFLKKRVSPTVWISVLLAVAGLYCLCIKDSFSIAPSDLLVMLCAFGYTLHILVIDYFTQKVDGVKMSCIQFLSCAVLSAILMLIFEHPTWADITPCIGSILYVGVFSSGVAYTLQILAQKDSNPTIVALLLSLESVFGAVSGAIFLHETMTGKELVGCVLMLIAVVLAQIEFPSKKKAKSA
jgi:drug/metabolite transporter (DMT)-like permease